RARRRGRSAKVFEGNADLGSPNEEGRRQDGSDPCGKQELHAVGHLDHAAAFADEGLSKMIVRSDYLAIESEVADQIHGPRLGGEKAVGAALDEATVDALGFDHAAEARSFFDQCPGDSGFEEIVGSGQAGYAAADNSHGKPVVGCRLSVAGWGEPVAGCQSPVRRWSLADSAKRHLHNRQPTTDNRQPPFKV